LAALSCCVLPYFDPPLATKHDWKLRVMCVDTYSTHDMVIRIQLDHILSSDAHKIQLAPDPRQTNCCVSRDMPAPGTPRNRL